MRGGVCTVIYLSPKLNEDKQKRDKYSHVVMSREKHTAPGAASLATDPPAIDLIHFPSHGDHSAHNSTDGGHNANYSQNRKE